MKASELMIGDWVMSTHPAVPRPIRVKEIYDRNVGYKNGLLHMSFIEPIPLTPEILEKNFEPKGERYYCGDEFNDIDINEYTDGLWEVTVWNVEIGMLDCKAYVCCVHELQHVLRLCEIDKDIEL